MPVFEDLAKLFRREASHRTNIFVAADHIDPAPAAAQRVVGGEAYFRLWVSQMYLKHDRDWFKTWYPVVHAVTSFAFADLKTPLEVAQVVGPTQLKNIDDKHLDRVIGQNYALTPLVPFKGGTVQIRAGLVAMEADDALRRFVDVVGSFATLVSVPQLSTALSIADTLSTGVQQLLGVGNKSIVLAYIDTFVGADAPLGEQDSGRELTSSYLALINAPSGTYDESELWVQKHRLLHGRDLKSAKELSGVDYMLVELETRRERDDWDQLSNINGPFSKAIEALGQIDPTTGQPKLAEADSWVRTAAVAALSSPDLTTNDRMRVARAIRERFSSYRDALDDGPGAASLIHREQAPTIFDVADSARGMSHEPVSLQELFSPLSSTAIDARN